MRSWRNGRRCGRGGKAARWFHVVFQLGIAVLSFAIADRSFGEATEPSRRDVSNQLISLASTAVHDFGRVENSEYIQISMAGQYVAAEVHCRFAVVLDPTNYEAYLCLSAMQFDGSHFMLWPIRSTVPAVLTAERAANLNPERPEALNYAALLVHKSITRGVGLISMLRSNARQLTDLLSPTLSEREQWNIYEQISDDMYNAEKQFHLLVAPHLEIADRIFNRAFAAQPDDFNLHRMWADIALAQNQIDIGRQRLAKARDVARSDEDRRFATSCLQKVKATCATLHPLEICLSKTGFTCRR